MNQYFLIGLIFAIIIFLRLPSIAVPLFSEVESASALMANCILNGGMLYRDVVDHKGPIMCYIYAIIFLFFGKNNMMAVHIGLTILILVISLILYRIGVLIGGKKAGLWTALFFGAFSYATTVDLLDFHTEWSAILFTSIGIYFFLQYVFNQRSFSLCMCGFSFGLAFFSKQPALLDFLVTILFCYFFLSIMKKNIKETIKDFILLISGFSLIPITFVRYFYVNNALKDFWFYFWEYNNKYYVPEIAPLERLKLAIEFLFFDDLFFRNHFLLLVFWAVSIFIIVIRFYHNSKKINKELIISGYLIALCISSYAGAAYAGRNFYHYYIMILPAFCLLGGKTMQTLFELPKLNMSDSHEDKTMRLRAYSIRAFLIAVIAIGIFPSLIKTRNILHKEYLSNERRKISYLIREDLYVLTNYIRENSEENEKIFVWGWYPDIYVLANRMPASRYIYCNFLTGLIPWTNTAPGVDTTYAIVPGTWDILMDELRRNKPQYIVDTTFAGWGLYYKYPIEKFPQLHSFLMDNYTLDKIIVKEQQGKKFITFRLFKRSIR